jgi:glycosyltransferase involved in cell wall biosynthesis
MTDSFAAGAHDTSKRIHVLYLIDQLCETGGAERALLQTIRLLPKEQFRCSLITFKIDQSSDLFRNLPCSHYVYSLERTYDWNAMRTAIAIRKFMREEKVQIVHTFHETSDLWGGLVARMWRGPSLVSSRRDMGILRRPKHTIAYRLMNRFPDLVFTVSEQVRRYCIETDRLPPERVLTLYNGLEFGKICTTNGIEDLADVLQIDQGTRVVVTVGHIRRVKGIDVLVETAARVMKEFPNVVFLVVGRDCEPSYLKDVEARIRELSLQSKVRFLGEMNNIHSLLKLSTLFFLPSRSEGFSNALIEAMACGRPAVVTNVGGNPEAIEDGRTGYIVESEDAEAASDRIVRLLRDPMKANVMGTEAKKVAEAKFTADAMIQNLITHYQRVVSARGN